jgi:tetratricopeptide (TPR) repeat protein
MQDLVELPRTLGLSGDAPAVPPPLVPRVDEPPLDRLPPEWFERLCVDLAIVMEGVAFRLYAKPGQRDEGIDMYGRRSDGSYVAWQVKRRASLPPTVLSRAFDDAAAGALPFAVSRLVVAGSFDDRDRHLLDALEQSRGRHPTLELELVGRGQITQALSRHPAMIAKYLGPDWVSHMTAGTVMSGSIARPVTEWAARFLGVHPAIPGRYRTVRPADFVLPEYVERPHDRELREHLMRIGHMETAELVVVRGGSCAGKTRTAYEGVRHFLPEWTLYQPIDIAGLVRDLSSDALESSSVLWLDDFHAYLADPRGEELAASLRRHLQRRGPIVVLATIWPEAHNRLSGGTPGRASPARQAEALLRSGTTVDVPDSFSPDALERARVQRDQSLDDALKATESGLVCQTLAAGPDLVRQWQDGSNACARALISAAVDARRHRIPPALSVDFLRDAAAGYLTATERAEASTEWFGEAMAFASEKVRGVAAPFSPVPRAGGLGADAGVVKLADYLEQEGSHVRDSVLPPVSFWDAVLKHVHEPETCSAVGWTAERREYFRIASTLFRRAAEQGDPEAAHRLAARLRQAGHIDEADRWVRSAAATGHHLSVQDLEGMSERSKERNLVIASMWQVAAEREDSFAVGRLAWCLERVDRFDEAEIWWRRGTELGDTHCTQTLARRLASKGQAGEAEALLRRLIDKGDDVAVWELMALLIRTGREEQVRTEWEKAFNKGCGWRLTWQAGSDIHLVDGLWELPVWDWLHELARAGNTLAMRSIARALLPDPFDTDEDEDDEPPDDKRVEVARTWLTAAVEAGDSEARSELDHAPFARSELERAVAERHLGAILTLAERLEREGSEAEAETYWRQGVAAENEWATRRLARLLVSRGRTVLGDAAIEGASRAGVAEAHLVLADALEAEGRLSEAQAHFLRADEGFGSRLPLLEFLYRHRRLRECERRAREIIQVGSVWSGDEERAHEMLGEILRSTGRSDEADRVEPFGFEPDGSTANAW